MDFDPRRVAVSVVGFSMAMVGMILSVIAPAISSAIPGLQPNMPALILKPPSPRRITSGHRHDSEQPESAHSGAMSAESVVSTSATSSQSSAEPPSPVDEVDEAPLQFIDVTPTKQAAITNFVATPTKSPHSGRACFGRKLRMRNTPKRMSSIDSSSSSRGATAVYQDNLLSSQPPSASASPAHSVLTFSPCSSIDTDAPHPHRQESRPAHASSASLDDHLIGFRPSDDVRPGRPVGRRARTFLGISRTKKHERSSTLSHPLSQISTVDVHGRASTFASDNGDQISIEGHVRRSRSLTSTFSKWKGKGKAKEKNRVPSSDLTLVEAEQPQASSSSTKQAKKRCPLSRARTNSDAASAPPPPPRTQPYQAPYNFPMPNSPEAVDYVQRTRNEFILRSNTEGTQPPPAHPQSPPQSQPQSPTSPSFAAPNNNSTRHSFPAPAAPNKPRPILASASSAPARGPSQATSVVSPANGSAGKKNKRPMSLLSASSTGPTTATTTHVSFVGHARSSSLNASFKGAASASRFGGVDEHGILVQRSRISSEIAVGDTRRVTLS